MPKGTKLHLDNTQLVYVCKFKGTERVFETEHLYEMYRKVMRKYVPVRVL